MFIHSHTNKIRTKALELGFTQFGVAKAQYLHDDYERITEFLQNNWHADMYYMENNLDKRLDPRKLVNDAKSVIMLSYNYYAPNKLKGLKISKYAYGYDYHKVIKTKLKELYNYIQQVIPLTQGRYFVDSAPVLEKSWAVKAGLGWIGKNTLLISKGKGSFFFLATIIIDQELIYNNYEEKNLCGNCTKCIDACPTQAIIAPKKLDSGKCISYLTIENKSSEIAQEFKSKFKNWIFGCDICQDVCPWNNKFSVEHNEPLFDIREETLKLQNADWLDLNEETFKTLFKYSALNRAGFKGLKRNINFICK
ncbi:MAG: tRNA epoxyqueuosine(34) reductase QueG [Solitalea-like symbiont of Tyrophagus putrescentiae]